MLVISHVALLCARSEAVTMCQASVQGSPGRDAVSEGLGQARLRALQGAGISFRLEGGAGSSLPQDARLEVYTTRPDTVRLL